MCDDGIPNEGLDPYEALEAAKDRGWVPALVVLARLKLDDGEEPTIDADHLHFFWGVDVEVALQIALQCVAQLHMAAVERNMRRAREN